MKRSVILVLLFVCSFSFSNAQIHKSNSQVCDALFTGRGEIYFRFKLNDPADIHRLTRIISIDNVKNGEVYAYASKKEFLDFLDMNYPYQVMQHPGTLIPANELLPGQHTGDSPETTWNFYPTYQQYLSYMSGFASAHPDICRLDTVGTTVQGRLILVLKISDSVNLSQAEPQLLYTSSIHGDETTGYVLMLHLIDYLLSGYGTDARITDMINNTEIFINPLANPDGTYHGGDNTVYGATRYNANNIDLNRNFPDPKVGPHPDGNAWQPETQAWMAFSDNHHISMSLNFHGGSEVFNYPWDTWSKFTADDVWWQFVAREYVDTVHVYGPSGYLTDENNGITDGYAWYEVNGGRQDYMNYWHSCREATLEISAVKTPPTSQLPSFWNYNYRSFLNYIDQVHYGFSGVVTDTVTGEPVAAQVFIFGHDVDNSQVYSTLPAGFYSRHIADGNYSVSFSAPGYFSKSVKNVNVTKWNNVPINVQLRPLTYGINESVIRTTLIYPNPNMGSCTMILPELLNAPATYAVINNLGKTVVSGIIPASAREVKITGSNLQPGLYVCKINCGARVYLDKMMVSVNR